MEGLSAPAGKILEKFSTIPELRDYQLVGGTALAIALKHRLSEDLDFCRWVPDRSKSKYGVDAKNIHHQLQVRFGPVKMNHLDFSQVNYYVENPGVRITFYHTDLKKPSLSPIPIIGNIKAAALPVLAGSKLYVITQRRELRDLYDLDMLISGCHVTFGEALLHAGHMDRRVTAKNLLNLFSKATATKDNIDQFNRNLKPANEWTIDNFNQAIRQWIHELEQKIQASKRLL